MAIKLNARQREREDENGNENEVGSNTTWVVWGRDTLRRLRSLGMTHKARYDGPRRGERWGMICRL